jgi:YD repeat-containing protein
MAAPSGTTTYSYNSDNELTTAVAPGATTSYSYDANGDETAAGSSSYAYNLASELTSATAGGTATTYTYDGLGDRLTATSGSTTMSYGWDTNFALPQIESISNASGSQSFVYGDQLISLTTQMVRMTTDTTGSATSRTSRIATAASLTRTPTTCTGHRQPEPITASSTRSSLPVSISTQAAISMTYELEITIRRP